MRNFDSEPGHGTSFKLLLLVASDKVAAERKATHSEQILGTATLLVVEDDHAVRQVVVRLITMLGYSMLEASDARDALRIAAAGAPPIDAVLTDIVMPATQGPELAKQLALSHPDIKIIYMSGQMRGAFELDGSITQGSAEIVAPRSMQARFQRYFGDNFGENVNWLREKSGQIVHGRQAWKEGIEF